MSVVIETTLGDITVDLYMKRRPRACLNFLKLCKIKYYNYNLFHTISRGFIAQTGDPTGKRTGGESIFGVLEGPLKRYFEAEVAPRIKHTTMGMISFVGNEEGMIGSQFFLTLGTDLSYLDEKHCVFGEVVEGLDVVEIINEAICDNDDRPYQDIRITHTVILDDPFPDQERLCVPSRSPSPSAERLQGGRIAPDEEIDETAGKNTQEVNEMLAEREAKARATILEMVGDLPDADMAPPENVLFICKLNPVTNDDDLEIIFSRFGKIKSCEVIRDRKSGDSLQYAFVEFEEQKSCEDAYFKMDNVLIDDRRIHVDFSQSVSKIRWLGKGRGVKNYGEKENNLGKGQYDRVDRNGKKRESNKRSDNFDRRGDDRKDKSYSQVKDRKDRDEDRRDSRKTDRNESRKYDRSDSKKGGRRDREGEDRRDVEKSERRRNDESRDRKERRDKEGPRHNSRERSRSPQYKRYYQYKEEKGAASKKKSERDKEKSRKKSKEGKDKNPSKSTKRRDTSSSSSDSEPEKRRKRTKKKKKKRSRSDSSD